MQRASFLSSLAAAVSGTLVSSPLAASAGPKAPVKALVLSGGVAKGVYEAGVLEALAQSGAAYDLICGTSIGALNGAMFATGKTDELRTLWHHISNWNVLKLRDVRPTDALINRVPLKRYANSAYEAAFMRGFFETTSIERILGKYVDDQPALNVPMLIGATNISERKGVAFYRQAVSKAVDISRLGCAGITTYYAEDALFRKILLASASVPGAFPAVEMAVMDNGKRQDPASAFVDGGIANNTPIKFANAAGATQIDVVFLDTLDESLSTYPNTIALGFELWGVMQRRMIEDDVRMTLAVSNMPSATKEVTALRQSLGLYADQRVTINSIRPRQDLPVSAFGFDDQNAVNSTYHIGYLDGRHGFMPLDLSDFDGDLRCGS